MAAFEVIALDTATPQLRAPGAADTYTFPRAVELPLGTANGVLYLNGSKVVSSGSGLTFDGTNFATTGASTGLRLIASSTDAGGSVLQIDTTATVFGRVGGSTTMGYVAGTQSLWTIGGSEQMRLTSTGLGIGTSSPANRLHVAGASTTQVQVQMSGQADMRIISDTGYGALSLESAMPLLFRTSALERMRLDASGNLGLGVAPSAWATVLPVLQTGNASFSGYNNQAIVSSNYYFNAGNKYIANGFATQYAQSSGQHVWYTAPSGTAGNAISFTQAMTLDASGNLLIGKTSSTYSASNRSVFEINNTDSSIIVLQYGGANGYYLQANSTAAYLWNSANTPWIAATNNLERARIPAAGGMVVGTAALATTATDGFLYVPTCAGTPTGTPTTQTGTAPIVINTTNNKLYFYSGGAWRDAGP